VGVPVAVVVDLHADELGAEAPKRLGDQRPRAVPVVGSGGRRREGAGEERPDDECRGTRPSSPRTLEGAAQPHR
jgi:hypothetical protein